MEQLCKESAGFSVLGWRVARFLFKYLAEMVLVIIPEPVRNFADAPGRASQQQYGFLYFEILRIPDDGPAGHRFEDTVEIIGAYAKLL